MYFENLGLPDMQIAKLISMRTALLLAVLAAVHRPCFGQAYPNQVPSRPYCDEMPGRSQCDAMPIPYPPPADGECRNPSRYTPPCEKAPPEQPREAPRPTPPPTPRPAPAPQPQYEETGYYQAGPRSGVVEGASGAYGFRGGAITLPRLRLELPSFELPSIFHASHGARMHVRESIAPWVSTGFQRVTSAVSAPQTRAREAAPPEEEETPRPRSADEQDCDALKAKYEEKIEELNRKLDECDRMRRSIEQSICDQSRNLPGRVPVQQGPECIPPGPGHAVPGRPQCPPGVDYCPVPPNRTAPPTGTAPPNQSQPSMLPAPAAGGPAAHAGQPQVRAHYPAPHSQQHAYSDHPQAGVVTQHAAPPAGQQALLQRPVSRQPNNAPVAAQGLLRMVNPHGVEDVFRQANPNVVPASHLGTPRGNLQPRLEPVPQF